MNIQYITPKDYAATNNITLQAVTKSIRTKGKLTGISRIEKVGRFYLLYPDRVKK